MTTTTVKVYLRRKGGGLDYFTTKINLSERDAHSYYINKWWNMGAGEYDKMMFCYKVETISTNNQ
jgi:hypothetical protein